ncbi:pseudouridine synthase [uncultured Paludibaculum sp.]|uniref:pseudouridine synthase n=1 Tax=uncultured Paludibaculum sp. TaxID=1765020 RepID=UPI002AAC1219|nr:pseudouridine synthase [uncultured Paludibaculum sp.]
METPTHRHLLFYKPYGVLTQFTDESGTGRPTLKDHIPVPSVFAAGRLDADSEGLLLLTSDGALQHRLTDPRFEHPRTYWAQVEGTPTEAALAELRQGVVIQGRKTRPARVRMLDAEPALPPRDPPIRFRRLIPTAWIELILTEGRNRQVRRMTAAAGLPTLRLVRVGIGSLTIDGLAPGEWRDLTDGELKSLNSAGQGSGDGRKKAPAQPPAAQRPEERSAVRRGPVAPGRFRRGQ